MIKILLNLVMPKQLGFLGTALAIGSAFVSIAGSNRREDEINAANANLRGVQRGVAAEQAVRSRRDAVRSAQVAQANVEALEVASGNTSSGASNAGAEISGALSRNLGDINTSLARNKVLSDAGGEVANAGKPTRLEQLNTAISPFINSNIDKINNSVNNIFAS